MPTPAAESDAYVSPKRRRSSSDAARTSAETLAPSATRATGPIQPRSTASTKKKTMPRSVTAPPVQASARAPSRTERSSGSRGGFGGRGGRAARRSGWYTGTGVGPRCGSGSRAGVGATGCGSAQ